MTTAVALELGPAPAALHALRRTVRLGLAAGGAALVACLVGAFVDFDAFAPAWLYAWTFWTAVATGCLGMLMVWHLTGGRWGLATRRVLEAGSLGVVVLAATFVPIGFALDTLYPWALPHAGTDPTLAHKAAYLNAGWFLGRSAVCLGVWLLLAALLCRWSAQQDAGQEVGAGRRCRVLSGPGLCLLCLTMSIGAFDWLMSLEPHWYSTTYGILLIVGAGVAGLGFALVMLRLVGGDPALRAVTTTTAVHGLGNLLLTFVLLWTYVAFAQFTIIWHGDLAEEIPWYEHRSAGGWAWVVVLLALLHFALPLLVLLQRAVTDHLHRLWLVALGLLLVRLADHFWLVQPALHPHAFTFRWQDAVTPIAIGGVYVAFCAWWLGRRPLVQRAVVAAAVETHG